jgi:hypothetical protein
VVCGSGVYGLMRARIVFGGVGADIRLLAASPCFFFPLFTEVRGTGILGGSPS